MQFSESWLRSFINPPLSTEQLAHALTMAGLEVEKLIPIASAASAASPTASNLSDPIFEIKLTPNRADCLSVFGIAREVAAITGLPLHPPTFEPVKTQCSETLPVKISAFDLCPRFSARIIRNVNARAKTPAWIAKRLEQAGQRSLSVLTDLCHYGMLEFGYPSYVFDLNKIRGPLEIRWGQLGESLKLLNGHRVELDQTVGVVADQQAPLSLAGIIGGEATAVSANTRDVYLKAAFWHPDSIRGRARRYRCLTEAAHRFERGVDYLMTASHLEYLTQLIIKVCGGFAGPIDDQMINLPTRTPVTLRVARTNRILGVAISADEIAQILMRLGLPFECDGDTFSVTPPSYRFDIEIEEDLIEEIARIYGFENIPARFPIAPNVIRATDETHRSRSIHTIRHALVARDYTETMNFSFVDASWERDFAGNDQPIRLLNPIASQFSVMRSTLISSLVNVLRYNLNRKAQRVRLFEIGRIFYTARADHGEAAVPAHARTVAGIIQPQCIAALAYGPVWEEQWGANTRWVDFFDLKGDLETLIAPSIACFIPAQHPALHPGRSARIELNHQPVGWLGELHPQWLKKYGLPQAPIIFEVDVQALIKRPRLEVSEISKFPPVTRDISVIVDQKINVQTLLDALRQTQRDQLGQHVQQIVLLDIFQRQPKAGAEAGRAPQEKSLTFRITLQDTEATLRDETVNLAMKTLVERLMGTFGASVRIS